MGRSKDVRQEEINFDDITPVHKEKAAKPKPYFECPDCIDGETNGAACLTCGGTKKIKSLNH